MDDDIDDGLVVVTEEMEKVGAEALQEQTYGTDPREAVSLVYMAMEYQRLRASAT